MLGLETLVSDRDLPSISFSPCDWHHNICIKLRQEWFISCLVSLCDANPDFNAYMQGSPLYTYTNEWVPLCSRACTWGPHVIIYSIKQIKQVVPLAIFLKISCSNLYYDNFAEKRILIPALVNTTCPIV